MNPFPHGAALRLCKAGVVLSVGNKSETLQEYFHGMNSTKLELFGLSDKSRLETAGTSKALGGS